MGFVILLAVCTCLVFVTAGFDTASGDTLSQTEPSADPFERLLPINYNNYQSIYYFEEICEWNGVEIPEYIPFVECDGMDYWLETDSNGNRVAQLVNIGQVNEGDIVRIPKSIVHEGESYAVVSVGVCFQPLSIFDSKTNDYLTHIGICGNPVEVPAGIDESGYLRWSEPTHYSLVFEGKVKVQDFAFCEFDLFHGTTGTVHCYYTKSGITSVTFEEGVSSIGQWAFAYSGLESITVPDADSVGKNAFHYTEDLNSVNWASDADIPDYVFKSSALSEITISGSPESIGEWAFSGTNITSINIPDSVKAIGEHAFHFCDELVSVSIGKGVTVIPTACFAGCGKLTDFSASGTIKEVGPGAFYDGPKLDSFDFSGIEEVGKNAFVEVFQGNERIILDLSHVKRIEDGAFSGTTAPVELILSSELEYVGNGALNLKGDLTGTEITIPAGCIIGKNAFDGAGLTSVTLGDGCTVGMNAFRSCTSLENVYFGENCVLGYAHGVNSPEGIFSGSGLKTLFIPKTLDIGRAAFYGCGSLESVVFENGREEIGQECFKDCINLSSVTFPDGLKTIGVRAFEGCAKLDVSGTVFTCTAEEVLSWSPDAFSGTASIFEYRLFEGELDGAISLLRLKLIVGGVLESCSFMVDIAGAENSMQLDEPYSFRYTMPDDIAGVYDYAMGKKWPALVFDNGLFITAKDGCMYDSSGFTLVKVPYNQTNLNIADHVDTIAPQACKSTWITLVHIPESVITIGDEAFYDCTRLNVVEFEGGVEYIGDRAFSYTSLTEISLPSSVRYVGDAAFYTMKEAVVNIPCDSELTHVGAYAFRVINGGSLFIPSGLTETGDLPFHYSMSEIYLGDGSVSYNTDFLRSTSMIVKLNGQRVLAHPFGVTFYLPLGTDISGIYFDQLLGCEDGRFGGYYVPTSSGPLLVDEKVDSPIGEIYLYTSCGQISDPTWIADGDDIILSLTVSGYWTQHDVTCSIDRETVTLLDSESPYVLRIRVSGDVDGAVVTVAERTTSGNVTVTFDSDGGSECAPISVGTGRTISVNNYPIPVRNRSEFLGWENGEGIMVEPYSPISADITLHAVWADAEPRLVFDEYSHMVVRVNGTVVESGCRVSSEDEISLEWIANEGYTFGHWILNSPSSSADIQDCAYSFSGVTDDLTISVSEGYYNPSDSLRYINSVEFPKDYEAFYLQWMTSFVQDTSGSMWTGGAGTPLVVNDRLYVRAGGIIYMYDLDTGRILGTVESYDSGGYYSYIGYANGLVFDFKTHKVYDLDLNYVCDFPGGSKVLWDDTGIYLGGSGTFWKYSLDMKEMIWSKKGCTGYSSWGVTGGIQLYDGYLYWIGVRDSAIVLQSLDAETGTDFHEIVLSNFKNYLLDDGWITCYNNTLYFTIYSTGLFGDNSGATGGGVVAVAFENGLFSSDYCYYELSDRAQSNFIVYDGRGYVNSGFEMYVFDVNPNDGRILTKAYSYDHGRYTHGGITLNVSPGSDVAEIIFVPYDPTMSIMVFYDAPGQMLPKYRNIYTQVPSQYNTQCVRFTDDGRIYFYNDAGNVCVLGDRIESLFLMIRENDRIRCVVYDGTVEETISEFGLSDSYKYMFNDFNNSDQLQFDESLTGKYSRYYFSDVPLTKAIYKDDQQWYSEKYGMMTLEEIKSGRLYLGGEAFLLSDKDAYSYSIRYVDLSGNEIGSTVTGSAPAGTVLEVQDFTGRNIAGYIYRDVSSVSLTISPDESRNVLILSYDLVRTVVVELTDASQDGRATVDNVQLLAAEGNPVEFVLPQGSIELDNDVLKNLGQSATIGLRTIEISELEESQKKSIPDGAVVFSITVESAGIYVHELGGMARITLPAAVAGSNPALWYLDDSGTMHRVEDAVFGDGTVSFTTDHLSFYVVGEIHEADRGGFPTLYVAVISIAAISLLGALLLLRRKSRV